VGSIWGKSGPPSQLQYNQRFTATVRTYFARRFCA
jgi:hypothetical protein